MTKPRIGVLTSGGDCPGLNAVLRGIALAAEKLDLEVLGFRDGFEGLLAAGKFCHSRSSQHQRHHAARRDNHRHHKSRTFRREGRRGERAVVDAKVIADARRILKENRVEALIIVGGDGSMTTALQLQEAGINCIGVPKTSTTILKRPRDVRFRFCGRHGH